MAVIALSTQQCTLAGITPTRTGSLLTTNSYTFPNSGRTFVHAMKTAAVDAVLTFVTAGTVQGLAIADPTVTVGATTGDVMIGPFNPLIFNDSNGLVSFSADDVDGLTVAIVQLS